MPTLAQHLERQPGDRVALITTAGALSVAQLLERVGNARRTAPTDRIARVNASDATRFLVALIAREGWVDSVYLAPASMRGQLDAFPDDARGVPGTLAPGALTRILMPTSGTTGAPKFIDHSLATLTATTRTASDGPAHRWGLLYDPARFAGLQVVLQALLGGSTLVAPPLDDIESAVAFLATHGVTALSGTPSFWRKLLMTRAAERLRLRQVTLGGEIADRMILQALKTRFPDARIAHLYASTEAGVGFSVSDGEAGFPASYLDAGAVRGVELRVRDDGHLLVKRNDAALRPANVAVLEGAESGFIDTGDLVERRGDRVHFLGRASGVINVGGNKVSPEVVEEVLCRHPRVVAARVFGKRSSVMGSLVAAEVQLRDGSDASEVQRELKELCKRELPREQQPASIAIVAELGVNSSGKIDRGAETP